MAKNKIKTYRITWEPEDWQYGPDGKSMVIPCYIRERKFLWITKIVAGPFKDFKEAGDYVYNNLHGKLTKKQHRDIYG